MVLTETVLVQFLSTLEDRKLCLGGNNLFPRLRYKVSDKDIIEICKFIDKHKIISLELGYNNISDDGLFILIFYLKNSNYELAHLNLMCNNITSNGIKFLIDAGSELKVKTLRLNGNKFGPKGGKYIATFLEKNDYIQHLDIGETDQDIESLVHLAATLQSPNVTLRSLDLSRPLLMFSQPHAAEILGKMLSANVHLRKLVLRKCGLGDHDMELLSMGLHKYTNEKFVIPTTDFILQDEESSSYTETVILTEESETDVEGQNDNWSQNEGNKIDLKSFSEETTSLRTIYNPFRRVIVKDGFVTHLQHLDLSCNLISDDTIDYLRPYLLSGPPLLSLNVSHNILHDIGAIELSKCIPSTKLEVLDIGHNQVRYDGIRSLIFLLKRSSQLQRIYIWGNQLDDRICKVLHETISHGNILQENIDVIPYVVDEIFHAAYNNEVENHQIKYYCITTCPLYTGNSGLTEVNTKNTYVLS